MTTAVSIDDTVTESKKLTVNVLRALAGSASGRIGGLRFTEENHVFLAEETLRIAAAQGYAPVSGGELAALCAVAWPLEEAERANKATGEPFGRDAEYGGFDPLA